MEKLTQKLQLSESEHSWRQHLQDSIPGTTFEKITTINLDYKKIISEQNHHNHSWSSKTFHLRVFAVLEIHILSVAVVFKSVVSKNAAFD